MQRPEPVQVLDLFPEERAALLELPGLTAREWLADTVCAGWSAKDIVAHILGSDFGNLARGRDAFGAAEPKPGEDLVTFVNRLNDAWVQAARRLSPQVLRDLLAISGHWLFAYFASLDLSALGGPVSWAGPEPAPVWLDVAREYTERWVHQQQIRDAVGKNGLTGRRFLGPVLATFAHALPVAFRGIAAPPGSVVHVQIRGESGGDWTVAREAAGWKLYAGATEKPNARVALDESVAWRLFTKGMGPQAAEREVSVEGDRRLGEQVLRTVAIIA